MDRLRAMRVFTAVARAGSLSRAARDLGLPLSTLSRILASLEIHLGATLVTRTTRHLALTPAGETYLGVCRRVLEEIEAVEDELAGRGADRSGRLALTAPVAFGRVHVLPIVLAFLESHPKVEACLSFSDHNVDLAREGIDLAVRIGVMRASALLARRVGKVGLVTCAAPSYLRRCGRPEAPGELKCHDCVGFGGIPGAGRWQFSSARHGLLTVKPRTRLEVSGAEAAVDAAVAGLGVTRVLSYQAEGALRDGRLVVLLDDYEDREIPVHVVRRRVRPEKPLVARFQKFAAEALRARLG